MAGIAIDVMSAITYKTGMSNMIRPTNDPKTIRIQLRCSPDYIAVVDEWRRKQPDIPVRSEAIRRLTLLGAYKAPKTKEK
jgi:hypothetical protein